MAKFVGTWVYDSAASLGDSVKTLRMAIEDDNGLPWGTAVSTGWTPTLQAKKVGETSVFATLTGSWEDSTQGAALFAIGAETTLVPASGAQTYESQLIMTYPGNIAVNAADDQAETYLFTVQRWP